ncbi:hypothetical protein B0A55_13185 [Friedmanniomyces simplex]|uniref:Pleckstrin homology domain-containing protein n=1 Tax=Friedmanniomyces simplex TaxID=329884 RepID=A0A4U0WGN0_9PEZI|nr:hypothetical protein B0A55_13185 [Friedmanniomyces simplex]
MADYFSEYATFVGSKGLPSPVDTPYETPGYIRSKRSSRATAASSREQSTSPPPLPPDATDFADKSRDGRYSALDPRRFTPTLHASLVSEILSLRRELDSKNNLVENLESNLSNAKTENETLSQQVSELLRDARKAKQQVQLMESGTYEAIEELVKERDLARHNVDDLRSKLDTAAKKARWQDEDASRTQGIWEQEKESWDNERRQFERRIHVTENRLRMFVDEFSAQQATADAQCQLPEDMGDVSTFKDSGLGNESDNASIKSATPVKHRRNRSSMSFVARSLRNSASTRASSGTPEPNAKPNGYTLADEMGIDEEDEYDLDEFEHADDELEYPEVKRRTLDPQRSSVQSEVDSKAKRVLGLTAQTPDSPDLTPTKTPTVRDFVRRSVDAAMLLGQSRLSGAEPASARLIEIPAPKVRPVYVDTGYQPSPPPSPHRQDTVVEVLGVPLINEPASTADAAIQTDAQASRTKKHALEVATRVAASPISPPETPVVIDSINWPENKRTSIPVRTEEIRVDKRLRRLTSHLPPMRAGLLPSPPLPDHALSKRTSSGGIAKIFTNLPCEPALVSPPLQSPVESSPEAPRNHSHRDLRNLPLRAIPLGRPVLAPARQQQHTAADGPLNRASQYGVTRPLQSNTSLGDIEKDSDASDHEEAVSDTDPKDLLGQQSLRKIQSAAVIRPAGHAKTSPQKGRRRKRSPTLTPIQSMAFESVPTPTKFPIPGLPTPLREHQSFDLVKGSVDLSKRPSTAATQDPQTSEETNLIDAIAATMVGEWMWKYVRKRKSFGIAEDTTNDFPHESVNGAVSITGHGTRHKRWVWLSPYERTIMWDNKQPTSGSALMGKKGRKLTIQSVLDVQDNTALPKGAELSSAFNRSILILTPQRALKFTTISHTRHELWMNALSFLAQSGRLPAQFPAVPTAPSRPTPPIPPQEPMSIKRQRSPSFGRATIRDSVRLAKGRRPDTQRSVTQPTGTGGELYIDGEPRDSADAGADFPSIPRLYITTSKHQRKRSNTSPRLPAPLHTLRSMSSSAITSSAASSRLHPLSTTGSSAARTSSSKSGSRQDSINSPIRPNFFEAVGTVRMEAFVDPNVRDGVLYVPAPPPPPQPPASTSSSSAAQGQGQGHWRRRGDSNLSQSTVDKRRAGYVFDENGMDPFKGF